MRRRRKHVDAIRSRSGRLAGDGSGETFTHVSFPDGFAPENKMDVKVSYLTHGPYATGTLRNDDSVESR